jgi:hypothetical protein
MSERNLRFLPEIPQGWRIWAGDVEVAGTHHRIDAAVAFAQGDGQTLTLEPEPTNPHDPKAIKVLGWSHSRRESYFVGYVPKDIAEAISTEYQPRIKNIWLGGYQKPVVYIRFDILVPKGTEEPERQKKPSRERKVKPVERPQLVNPPYIAARPPDRTYCENCKTAHAGFDCPSCGNTHPGGGAGNSCSHCNTSYRESRRSCPICTVEKNFSKASDAGMRGNLPKAIAFWWNGYDEARSNRFGFSYADYLPYTAFLAEAGYCDDAMALLKELRTHQRSTSPKSPTTVQQWDFYRELAAIHSAMSKALIMDPTPLSQTRQIDIVFHALLSELSERIGGRLSGYVTDVYPLTVNRMREILRPAKLNKKGRPEEAQQALVEYWYAVPKIDVQALRQDVEKLISAWPVSSQAKITKKSAQPKKQVPRSEPITRGITPEAMAASTPPAQPQVWFVIRGEKQHGPFSSGQLKKLATNGKIVPDDLVRRGDMAQSTLAKRIKGLFPPVAE